VLNSKSMISLLHKALSISKVVLKPLNKILLLRGNNNTS